MESSLPRRILRKGTHSCAECKRRKIRCFFDQNSPATCVQCRQRGTPCVSQDAVDISVSKEWETDERLKRVERMLEQITEKLFAQNTGVVGQQNLLDPHSSEQIGAREACDGSNRAPAAGRERINKSQTPMGLQASGPSTTSQMLARFTADKTQFASPKYAEACRVLHAAFPPQQDMVILFEAAKATILLQAVCNPVAELFTEKNTTSSSMLAIIPPTTSHPVILAKKLLQLALCIQQLDKSFDQSTLQGRSELRVSMNNHFELACGMVTCHEELLDSLEGIECLVVESVFLVNAGNLRKALLSIRRAITAAQFMGFSRKGTQKATLKQHDPNTRVCRDFTWKHISYLERYIALLLGMPTSITCVRYARSDKPTNNADTEWFERMQIDVCDQIIKRNQQRNYDRNSTMAIDSILNTMACHMSTSWWSPLDFQPGMSHEEMTSRMLIAQMQIIHYNKLTVLHVPFLLKTDTDERQFDYSKETCLYASREVLSRFMTFRAFIPLVYCCRPVDFCAFTAAITLLLFYLSRHGPSSGFQTTHQRITDLALVSRALDALDGLHRLNDDPLSRETAKLTRKLMDLEAHASRTNNSYSYGVADEMEANNSEKDTDSSLNLLIPYFGCIRLENKPQPPTGLPRASSSGVSPAIHFSHLQADVASTAVDSVQTSQAIQLQHDIGPHDIQMPSSIYHAASMQHEDEWRSSCDLPMPDIMAGVEDWAFQGVDTAFFDSLMSGTSNDFVGHSSWITG